MSRVMTREDFSELIRTSIVVRTLIGLRDGDYHSTISTELYSRTDTEGYSVTEVRYAHILNCELPTDIVTLKVIHSESDYGDYVTRKVAEFQQTGWRAEQEAFVAQEQRSGGNWRRVSNLELPLAHHYARLQTLIAMRIHDGDNRLDLVYRRLTAFLNANEREWLKYANKIYGHNS